MRSLLRRAAGHLKGHALGERLVRRSPPFYARARRWIARLEAADRRERRELTEQRLREVLRVAARTPYGRRVGANAELASWPLLEKATVRAQRSAFGTGRRAFAAPASTGGTTGVPLELERSPYSVVFEQACLDALMERLGADPARSRIAVLRSDYVKPPSDLAPPFWRFALGGRRLILSAYHLNAATLAHYAEALERFRPDLLWGYPSALESLCRLLMLAGRRLRIPRVLTSSEVLSGASWRAAEAALGCRLLDYYGQAERVALAWAAASGEYRFLPGYAHVELLPAGTEDGDELFEIVGTSLWNLAMPLVRYRTGDLLRVQRSSAPLDPAAIALGLVPFAGILGRRDHALLSPERARLIGISYVARDVRHVVRVQVIQEALDRVRVLVLPDAGFGAADRAQLLRNARTRLPESMRIEVEVVEALEQTALGKTPFVIHREPVHRALQELQAASHAALP